jgi:peptide deformylase
MTTESVDSKTILPAWAERLGDPVHTVLPFYEPSLRTPPTLFDFSEDSPDRELAPILSKFIVTKMREYKAAGISAPQLGIPIRVFAIGGTEEFTRVFFNPVIVGVSKEKIAFEERCISSPDFSLTLSRPREVAIQYYTEAGEPALEEYRGISARVILHEYDFMEGINFTNHASPFKLQWEFKKYKKKLKKRLQHMPTPPLTT